MVRDNTVYVRHILDAISHIEGFLNEVDEDRFSRDIHWQNAFIRELEVIGEASRKIDPEFLKIHPEIPWADIIGMRHKLINDYFEVALPQVWDTATIDIPKIKPMLRKLIS